MKNRNLNNELNVIGEEYKPMILNGSLHYLGVSIREWAERLGYADVKERYKNSCVIIPLKAPQKGMKVRVDGRTFVNASENSPEIVVSGRLAREDDRSFKTFVSNDSMICNFT